jgi:hypothetical protein
MAGAAGAEEGVGVEVMVSVRVGRELRLPR